MMKASFSNTDIDISFIVQHQKAARVVTACLIKNTAKENAESCFDQVWSTKAAGSSCLQCSARASVVFSRVPVHGRNMEEMLGDSGMAVVNVQFCVLPAAVTLVQANSVL